MKRFIETIKNIYRIEELRKRILYTLGIILIYRIGSYITLPTVDPSQLGALQKQTEGGLMGLINMFSGGAFSHASIFALGIMPYITASIIMQLLTMAVPYFQKIQREGESGQRKINQITRFLTIGVTAFQAPAYLTNLVNLMHNSSTGLYPFDGTTPGFFFWFLSIVILTTGTLFVMWLGERITENGLGQGISLLIMVGIIARLPFALFSEFGTRLTGAGGLVMFLVEIVVLVVVILIVILLVQGTRKVPVNYAKRVVGNKQYGGVRQYIPMKVNAAGVMPIIFAQAIMFIPITLLGFTTDGATNPVVMALSDFHGFWYNFIFAFMIVIFTYLYTAIAINPNQMAEDMKKNGGFIPGVKPGKKTAEFLDNILSRITLPGSLFLAFVAIMPSLVGNMLHVNSQFSQFYGGTSLLIMVGVILDTLQQIESHLLMRHYDGLTKTGRIKGRSSM